MSKNNPDLISFTVEGSGPFPLDMLRYDHCWPKTSADSHAMEYEPGNRSVRRVVLQTYSDRGYSARPTGARWESFTWRVVR